MTEHMAAVLLTSTAQIEQKVQMFHLLGTIFGAVALLFLALSLFLFFHFDIRTVIGEKTGRIARKSIAEMEKETAQSGKLRNGRSSRKREISKKLNVQELFAPLEEEKEYPTAKMASTLNTGQEATSVLEAGGSETSLLQTGENSTTVLDHEIHYEGPDDAPTEALVAERKTEIGKFVIIKNIMLIHTDEYI